MRARRARLKFEIVFLAEAASGTVLVALSARGANANSNPNRVRAAWGSVWRPLDVRGKRMTIDDPPLTRGGV